MNFLISHGAESCVCVCVCAFVVEILVWWHKSVLLLPDLLHLV